MVYVSEKLRHSGDEAPRGVSFLPSDKNNLFLQAHKKYAVFFLLLCTPRGRFQAQRACFSLFNADFRGSSINYGIRNVWKRAACERCVLTKVRAAYLISWFSERRYIRKNSYFCLLLSFSRLFVFVERRSALVVQRIEHRSPKAVIWVRFSSGVLFRGVLKIRLKT